MPTIIQGVEPDMPLRRPLPTSRRRSAAYTSDPANLEDHLAVLSLTAAEPVGEDHRRDAKRDRERDRRRFRGLGLLVDLAAQLAELRFDVGARDRCRGFHGRVRLR